MEAQFAEESRTNSIGPSLALVGILAILLIMKPGAAHAESHTLGGINHGNHRSTHFEMAPNYYHWHGWVQHDHGLMSGFMWVGPNMSDVTCRFVPKRSRSMVHYHCDRYGYYYGQPSLERHVRMWTGNPGSCPDQHLPAGSYRDTHGMCEHSTFNY